MAGCAVAWPQLFPRHCTATRSNGSATDNTATSKIVLFGGVAPADPATYLAGTRLWNGATWKFAG
jgi:hypothetical protein